MLADVPNLEDMLSVLDVGARTGYDIFTGPALPTYHGRAFGGQVVGQAIAAAGQTVMNERQIHSMHGYFLRPGNSDKKMTFEVARLYDGRSFSTRRTQVWQDGDVLMSMIASYQEQTNGLEHQETIDLSQIPEPESLPSVWERYGHLAGMGQASWLLNRPFDFRHVEGDIVLDVPKQEGTQHVWMRSRDQLPDDPLLHVASLAFASDYMLIEAVLRKHGIPWATPGMKGASLDHSMWFHRPFRADQWLLYALETPTAQGSRGLTHGRFYDESGSLVASVSQESMVRMPSQGEEDDGDER